MTEYELKPCPFCGGSRITIRRNGAGWYIGCLDCDMGFSTIEAPAMFWNRRPVEENLQAENARLLDEQDAETDEFNAGYDACRAGKSLFDDPCGPYDVWRAGFKSAAYDDMEVEIVMLKADVERLRAALEAMDLFAPGACGCPICDQARFALRGEV